MKPGDGSEDPTQRPDELAGADSGGVTEPAGESRDAAEARGYQLGALLGRGGMGEVVQAHDIQIGRDVALKRLHGEASEEALLRFLREAKIQARLDHPAILPVYELGHDTDGLPYFTMKRLSGTTLAALLAAGTATLQRLLRALVDVCLAIDLAHSRRVVHRDLKPLNIMLGDYGEVYIIDWGVARVLDEPDRHVPTRDDAETSSDSATKTGQLLGTPGYMAPEQIHGPNVGPPADIYALGAILFEILASEPLHPRGRAALASTLGDIATSPAARAPARSIPPELDLACTAALAADPGDRPTARQLADRIQRYLDGDRDVEHRRTLAADELVAARAALARGDRANAVFRAGRAVTFDPSSTTAVELLTSLIVEVPSVMPRQLSDAFEADEHDKTRERSRRALFPILMFFLLTPVLPFLHVAHWAPLVAMYASIASLTVMSFINWKYRRVPTGLILVAQWCVVVLFSRLTSPFVLTPVVLAAMLLASTAIPWFNDRKWAVATWTVSAMFVPMLLEQLGVFASTWGVSSRGLVIWGSVFETHGAIDAWVFAIANGGLALVVALFTLAIARDRRTAQRELYVQAWHLGHLLPRADARVAIR